MLSQVRSGAIDLFTLSGLILSTLAYLALSTGMPLTIVVSRMDDGMSSLVLLAVPLFVFLGLLIEMTGVAKAMVDFLASLLGHVRGGLALVGALALTIVVYVHNRREDVSNVARANPRAIAKTFVIARPALALPFVIRTVVVEGVATATEVSTVGIAYTCLVGLFVYRRFDWHRLYPMLVEAASLSGAILFIIGCATAMAWALTQSGFARDLAAFMQGVPGGKAGFIAIAVVAFVVLGSVLEGIPVIVLFGPLLFPIARAVGIHEVHYAMGLGLFAPPFGVGFYAACAIGRVDPDRAVAYAWPYLGALFAALLVIAAVPWLSIGFL